MNLYDAILCSTKRTFNLVNGICNAHYTGWGIDTDLFKSRDDGDVKYTFFHNAGWLGINYRKMTPAVILAFEAVSLHLSDATLFIHAQTELEKLPPEVVNIVNNNPRITYHIATVPAPGLYHKGRILVFPSKLEGLGLPLLEGMACGLPVVATDAPPMNEFVRDNYNGLLVKVAERVARGDGISFPEEIVDVNELAKTVEVALKECGEVEVVRQFEALERSKRVDAESLFSRSTDRLSRQTEIRRIGSNTKERPNVSALAREFRVARRTIIRDLQELIRRGELKPEVFPKWEMGDDEQGG
jgi:glycosyltransferase involved in cell wall biosynthesis